MKNKLSMIALALLAMSQLSYAAVSEDEASKLKTTLTPFGAEKAGNKEGTIPAWTGGLTKPNAPKLASGHSADQFAGEKPILQISSKNMAEHAGKLSEGVQALMKKYPTFRIDVYPTHRTSAAPQYIYDNTLKNATRAKLVKNGLSVEGAFGGIPFPIPKNGSEAIWNHILHARISSTEFGFKNIVGSSDGRVTVASRAENNNQSPYYSKNGTLEKWSGDFVLARFANTEPPYKAGEALVIRDNIDPDNSRAAWQYLVGQRRVRRAPTVAYDTPDFVASGANYFDEVIGFYGHPDRYQWKLVGKREMYIPYNTNKFFATDMKDAFVPFHTNPDKVRWELHRVWEVEATVAPGKRHVVPKRRFYLDEDTWAVSMLDGYDAEGKLWRTNMVFPLAVPEYPIVVADPVFIYNLPAGTMSCVQCYNGETWKSVPDKNESFFTGDALGSSSIR
jgi:Protein of unknown function (DUF1329)